MHRGHAEVTSSHPSLKIGLGPSKARASRPLEGRSGQAAAGFESVHRPFVRLALSWSDQDFGAVAVDYLSYANLSRMC